MVDYDFKKFTEDSSDDHPKYDADIDTKDPTVKKLIALLNDKPLILRYEKLLDAIGEWGEYLTREGPEGVDQVEDWIKEFILIRKK